MQYFGHISVLSSLLLSSSSHAFYFPSRMEPALRWHHQLPLFYTQRPIERHFALTYDPVEAIFTDFPQRLFPQLSLIDHHPHSFEDTRLSRHLVPARSLIEDLHEALAEASIRAVPLQTAGASSSVIGRDISLSHSPDGRGGLLASLVAEGYGTDDLDVELNEDVLSISGNSTRDEARRWFIRRVTLPVTVRDQSLVSARVMPEGGVEVLIPKEAIDAPTAMKIPVLSINTPSENAQVDSAKPTVEAAGRTNAATAGPTSALVDKEQQLHDAAQLFNIDTTKEDVSNTL